MSENDREIALRKHWVNAFATPIVTYPWAESETLNAELRALILEREAEGGKSVERSNVGGWHSRADFFDWGAPAVQTLSDRVQRVVIEVTRTALSFGRARRFRATYRMGAWANIMRHGHYHSVHNHPGHTWSGVYYVDIGKPEPNRPFNGQLELLDPRLGANMVTMPGGPFEFRYTVPPRPGLMVVFPSWLNHLVHPFFGDGERISVAFNVRVENLRFLDGEDGADESAVTDAAPAADVSTPA